MHALTAVLWGPHVLLGILLLGVFCTVRGRLPQQRMFRLLPGALSGGGGGLSAWGALSASLAGSLGVGNILGVAAALAAGGAGAIFWMWCSAFFGMATVWAESALSVRYRGAPGPIGYVQKALGPGAAKIYAAGCVLSALGMGTMAQTGAISAACETAGVPAQLAGAGTAALLALSICGGLKRAVRVTEKLVPFMAGVFLLAAGGVLFLRADSIPAAFCRIFREAFTLRAGVGGAAGMLVAMQVGISRGVFTNEAGLGSGTFALSGVTGKRPEQVGALGALQVFLDTLVLCTVTALCLLVSPAPGEGAAQTLGAFSAVLGAPGAAAVSVSVALFAFATAVAWSCYGMEALRFLVPAAGKAGQGIYVFFAAAAAYIGAVTPFSGVLSFCDAFNGVMAIPNLAAVFRLSGAAFSEVSGKFAHSLRRIRGKTQKGVDFFAPR